MIFLAYSAPIASMTHALELDRRSISALPSYSAALVPAVGYLRRSTDRQEQSIGDQRSAIEAYAEANDFRIVRYYTDDGISGTSTAGRRAFQKLIADAAKPNRDFALVIVYDIKRFGRIDNDEAGFYRHTLRSHGVEVRYASENFTGDGTDDLLRPVKQWQARQESKDLAKVTIRGLVSKARAEGGWWMGGAPPYGYDLRYESSSGEFIFIARYDRDGSKLLLDEDGMLIRNLPKGETIAVSKRDRCRLVPGDPDRVSIVDRIYECYASKRLGLKAISSTLNADGVPTARSEAWAAHYLGKWSTTTVKAILSNPVYKGDMVWNRRTDARFFRITGSGDTAEREGVIGRRLEDNDPSDWMVIESAHEPLISRALWERAASLRMSKPGSKRQRGINPRTGLPSGTPEAVGSRPRFLLSGLIRCSACSASYEGRLDRPSKANCDGERSTSYGYACGGYIRHGRSVCTRGIVDRDELERLTIESIHATYRPLKGKQGRSLLVETLKKVLEVEDQLSIDERSSTESAIETIDDRIRTLIDNISSVNRAMIDARLSEIGVDRRTLELRLARLRAIEASKVSIEEAVEDCRAFMDELETMLAADADPVERQAAVRRCVDNIVINRETKRVIVHVRAVPSCGTLPERLPTTTVEHAIAIGR